MQPSLGPNAGQHTSSAANAQQELGALPRELGMLSVRDQETLLSQLSARFAKGQGFSVATLNLDHIVKMRQDAAFLKAYQDHSHVVADGNPIVWLAGAAGVSVSLVPGSELIVPLSGVAARHGIPVALLGATDDTLNRAAHALETQCPGLRIVAKIAPPYGFDPGGLDADAAIGTLKESGAKLCFLALGAPKQEIFAARAQHIAPGCGFVSIGAGLDFLAGSQKRAPRWVQRIAMEWLWRMLSNPRRLALRYWRCFTILPGLYRSARAVRNQGMPSP